MKAKDWIYSIFLVIIIALIAISFINGLRYSYYSYKGVAHYFENDRGSACVTRYSFFDKEMDCYILDKEQK